MTSEEIKAKMENIEDPEIKKIFDNINEFILPKFQELQEKLINEKPGMLKMMKIAKDFSKNLQTEYKDKFGRDLEEDMKITNKHLGYSQSDMLNILNSMK